LAIALFVAAVRSPLAFLLEPSSVSLCSSLLPDYLVAVKVKLEPSHAVLLVQQPYTLIPFLLLASPLLVYLLVQPRGNPIGKEEGRGLEWSAGVIGLLVQ
jgi:hypothetical protein